MAVRSGHDDDRPFVGRHRELEALIHEPGDGRSARTVVVAGEAGLGKTRLVDRAIDASGVSCVVRGFAVPRSTPIPLELVWSALGPDAGADGEITHRGLAERLRNRADGPSWFVFEDVHWADADSLDVIERLISAAPLDSMVVVTHRPIGRRADDPVAAFLQRISRRPHVGHLRLEPLGRGDVQSYLVASGRRADIAAIDALVQRTGGNALLVTELLAAVDDAGDLANDLPWTLSESLRPEIDRLPEDDRRVVEAVAVLGSDVPFEKLLAGVGYVESDLEHCLVRLVGDGVLVESSADSFSFRHDLVREAVAEGLFARQHRRVHAAVHDALVAAGSDDDVALVSHAAAAGRTEAAADAARAAARRAFDEGRSQQALAFAEQALDVHEDDLELLEIAVTAGWMTGQERCALEHLDHWSSLTSGDPSRHAAVLHHFVRLTWEISDCDRSDRYADELERTVNLLDDGVARAQGLADLAQHHMLVGRQAEAIDVAERAIEVAERVGPPAASALLQARAERASATIGSSGGDARTAAVAELLTIADEAEQSDQLIIASRALFNTPFQHPSVDARRHVDRLRRIGDRAGMWIVAEDAHRFATLSVAMLDGDREVFDNLVEAAGPGDAKVRLTGAMAAIDDGDVERARALAADLPVRARSARYTAAWKDGVEAIADLVSGAGPDRFDTWVRELPHGHLADDAALTLTSSLLHLLVGTGVDDAMGTLYGRVAVDRSYEPMFHGIRAELRGDAATADRHYADAIEHGMCRGVFQMSELWMARSRTAGRLDGDVDAPMAEAAAVVANWPGARRDKLIGGSTPGPASAETVSGVLTRREREVAALVQRGLTNGGIAEELYISTKTASVHVSNILSKLQMSSRAEIAAWAASGGLSADAA